MICDLCQAVESEEYEQLSQFRYIPECKTCGDPLIILDSHKPFLTEDEQEALDKIMSWRFPDKKLRGIGMRSLKQHWHEHILDRDDVRFE